MADGCLDCEASNVCVVGIQLQGRKSNNLHRIITIKPAMLNFKCQQFPSKKKKKKKKNS